MKITKKIGNFFDHINKVFAFITGIIVIFIMLAVVYEVVMRYFFRSPTLWTVEVSGYGLVFITFLGSAWVLKHEGHVKIDLLTSYVKPESQIILNIFNSIIAAIVTLVIFWYSARVTLASYRTNYLAATELQTPLFIIYLIIPIGCFLLFIQFLRKLSDLFREFKASQKKVHR